MSTRLVVQQLSRFMYTSILRLSPNSYTRTTDPRFNRNTFINITDIGVELDNMSEQGFEGQ